MVSRGARGVGGGGDRGRSAAGREVEGKDQKRCRRHNTPQETSTESVGGRPPRLPQRQQQQQSKVTTVPKPGARTVPGRRVGSAAAVVAGVAPEFSVGISFTGAGFKIPRKKLEEGETGEERAREAEERARVLVKLKERVQRKKEAALKVKKEAATEKRARDEADKRKAKAGGDKKKVKAETERRKAKAAAEHQAKAQASAKKLTKAGTREEARFLKAMPPRPLPSREDVGVSVASIPAEAPQVPSAAHLNTPGVETLVGIIHENWSGPFAGRKPWLALKFKGKLVHSISQNMTENPPSGSVASRSPAVGSSLGLGFAAKTATAVASFPSGQEVYTSAASKSKIRSSSLATAAAAAAAGASTPVSASAAKSNPSLVSTTGRGLGRGKGKRGPSERKDPTVVKYGPFAPNGCGPKTTQEGTNWPKGSLTVFNRLKRRDT